MCFVAGPLLNYQTKNLSLQKQVDLLDEAQVLLGLHAQFKGLRSAGLAKYIAFNSLLQRDEFFFRRLSTHSGKSIEGVNLFELVQAVLRFVIHLWSGVQYLTWGYILTVSTKITGISILVVQI
ncbi:Hypothetical_protein [Hexamita inflata]|uniref:Hypothetical_protein n=1 Tax=Hexamita inflata TaxID=28002 RepID=A0AA86NF61_9EUKA|nr:Hypothetical protein HINF_LOCUS6040 [Hexamita inflata]